MSYVSVELNLDKKTLKQIDNLPDKVVYKIARKTLDLSVPIIPMSRGLSTSGQLRKKTIAYGVKGSNGDYHIGSPVNYASRVWNLPSSSNWTTPGTNNQWFKRALKRHSSLIVQQSINEAKKG